MVDLSKGAWFDNPAVVLVSGPRSRSRTRSLHRGCVDSVEAASKCRCRLREMNDPAVLFVGGKNLFATKPGGDMWSRYSVELCLWLGLQGLGCLACDARSQMMALSLFSQCGRRNNASANCGPGERGLGLVTCGDRPSPCWRGSAAQPNMVGV
jgi:hypothetical protein